jgi:hypothetical protein
MALPADCHICDVLYSIAQTKATKQQAIHMPSFSQGFGP